MYNIDEISEGISFGKEDLKNREKLRQMIAEYENQYLYSGMCAKNKAYTESRDNKHVYNGKGMSHWRGCVRVPSLKRSNKTWRQFYRLFPSYRKLMEDAVAGNISCVKGDDYVGVEAGVSNIATRSLGKNFVKLKILDI